MQKIRTEERVNEREMDQIRREEERVL